MCAGVSFAGFAERRARTAGAMKTLEVVGMFMLAMLRQIMVPSMGSSATFVHPYSTVLDVSLGFWVLGFPPGPGLGPL